MSPLIRDLSAIMAIYVVFMHSRLVGFGALSGSAESRSASLIGIESFFHHPGLAVRIPLFFAFSGWLFMRNVGGIRGCWVKIGTRLRTVGGPYLLWGVLPTFFLTAASMGCSAALSRGLVNPLAYHLWFLRHLLCVVLLTPLLLPLLQRRRLGMATLAAIGVFYLAGDVAKPFSDFLTAGDVLFFGIGGYVALHGIEVVRLSRPAVRILLPVYLSAVVASFMLLDHASDAGVNRVLAMFGAFLLVGSYRSDWPLFRTRLVQGVRSVPFFVYLGHEPLLSAVRRVAVLLLGTSEFVLIGQFFLAPLATAAILVGVARALTKVAPSFYSILTGGRSQASRTTVASR